MQKYNHVECHIHYYKAQIVGMGGASYSYKVEPTTTIELKKSLQTPCDSPLHNAFLDLTSNH